MIKRSWRSLLAGMALVSGMTASSSVFAADGCGATGCSDCQHCEQIFADAGQKLTEQLAGMSCCGSCGGNGCTDAKSCCAPASICDSGCTDPCGDALADACGEGCGDGCGESVAKGCGLFGEHGHGITFGGWTQFGYQSGPDGAFTGNGPLNNVNFGPGAAFSNAKEWDKFNLNQQALYLNKTADGSNGLGLGFTSFILVWF